MMIKNLLITSLLTFACVSCHKSHLEIEEIVNTKIGAMNNHNLDALGKLYADSAKIESVGFEKSETGPDGIRGAYTRYFASSPDLKYQVTKITTTDHSAVIEYTSEGTMRQSELEAVIPEYMIGKKYSLKNCTRIEVKNGKIIYEMSYFDQLSFLRQVGFFDQGG